MNEGDVLGDFHVSKDSITEYKFLIQKKNGSNVALKWDKYRKMTGCTLIRINNVDTGYIIILKHNIH